MCICAGSLSSRAMCVRHNVETNTTKRYPSLVFLSRSLAHTLAAQSKTVERVCIKQNRTLARGSVYIYIYLCICIYYYTNAPNIWFGGENLVFVRMKWAAATTRHNALHARVCYCMIGRMHVRCRRRCRRGRRAATKADRGTLAMTHTVRSWHTHTTFGRTLRINNRRTIAMAATGSWNSVRPPPTRNEQPSEHNGTAPDHPHPPTASHHPPNDFHRNTRRAHKVQLGVCVSNGAYVSVFFFC